MKRGEGGAGALREAAARGSAVAPGVRSAAAFATALALAAWGCGGDVSEGRLSPLSLSKESPSSSSSEETSSSTSRALPFVSLSFDEALARARAENKLVLLDVYTDWCGWCTRMDRDVFRDARVKAALLEFVPIRVNAEKGAGRTVADRYRVNGLPTFLVVDADGNVLRRFEGYHSVDGFLRKLGPGRRL